MRTPKKIGPGRWSYRGYIVMDDGYVRPCSYVADDYDGAPLETGGAPADHRCGEAESIWEALDAIDELIKEEKLES